jgi:hypothetical protein
VIDYNAIAVQSNSCDASFDVLHSPLLGNTKLLLHPRFLRRLRLAFYLFGREIIIDVFDCLLEEGKQVEGSIALLCRPDWLLPLPAPLGDWLFRLLHHELHSHEGAVLGHPALQPIVAFLHEVAGLVRLIRLAVQLVLVGSAAFAGGLLRRRVSRWPRGAFELVDALGVEGVGDALTVTLADCPVSLALLLHSNYNREWGKELVLVGVHFQRNGWRVADEDGYY